MHSEIAAACRAGDLKHVRPLAESIQDQYDNALVRVYLHEWPDAVPKFTNNHRCCCRRDSERDHHAWEILKEVFPRYIFVLMVASGAIAPRSKISLAVVTGIWGFYCLVLIYTATVTINLIDKYSLCLLGPNCIPRDATFGYATFIASFFSDLSNIVTMILVQTYVRDLLQSRELLTLIFSVDPARIRKPKWHW